MTTQVRRLLRATGFLGAVFLILAVAAVASAPTASGGTSLLSGRAFADGVIARAVDEATADATASREDVGPLGPMDDVLGRQAADAPSWFEQEVLPLAEACDLRALDDWSVVGFTMAGEVATVRQWVVASLEERGWALVETGEGATLAGIKEGGTCPWLLLSCTPVGDEVCIVVQIPVP